MAAPDFGHGGADLAGAGAYRMSMDHLGLDAYSPAMTTGYHPHHHQHPHSHPHPHPHPHVHAHAHQHQHQHQHQPLPQPFPRVPSQARPQPQQQQHSGGGQFGILAPTNVPQDAFGNEIPTTLDSTSAIAGPSADPGTAAHGQLSTKIVFDPPDLATWRDKLFNVDELIILTDEQFQTYFPHIDNVYSHRSTQRYKRKPFVSHYWDCRMKGRPSGTPKSEDPNKKKRKRNARERDLCDVKIKITEYSPGAQIQIEDGMGSFSAQQTISVPDMVGPGQKFWTIQRVNGNGGNGKGDGVAGPHRHTLAKSDEIKKNSVQRQLAKLEKETKSTQKPLTRRATGAAAATIKKHSKAADIVLYATPWCPFSQRVWIALEALGLSYQFSNCGEPKKPTKFLEITNSGATPVLRHGDFHCRDSTVLVEYLEDLSTSKGLLPANAQLKAKCRLWMKHIERKIVPTFYDMLKAHQIEDMAARSQAADRLRLDLYAIANHADEEGPFFVGTSLSLVDILLAPFALRLPRILEPLCGWTFSHEGSRWSRWVEALENDAHVKATLSEDELYLNCVSSMLCLENLPESITT